MQCTTVHIDNLAFDNVLQFLNMERVQSDQKLLYYYTGLESAEKLFDTLGPAFNNLTYFSFSVVNLSPINLFILMLVNL
jgi:hypothetical protein